MNITDIELEAALRKAKLKEELPEWAEVRKRLFLRSYLSCNGHSITMASDLGITRQQVWRLKKKNNLG
jgi:transcriptional regulator of acetoin/glycerol metabolism